jgi:hypothetical protein
LPLDEINKITPHTGRSGIALMTREGQVRELLAILTGPHPLKVCIEA